MSELFIYPIKSAAGISVDSLSLDITGPNYDRQWMLVNEDGKFLSQRSHPQMCLIQTAISTSALEISAPNMTRIEVPLDHTNLNTVSERTVTVWDDQVRALDCGDTVSQWFSSYLECSCRLVMLPKYYQRSVDPNFAKRNERVAFADGFPLLIVSQASLDDFNQHLVTPITMARFRPNIVISGCPPYAEDSWQSIMIGEQQIDIVKPCSRCIIPSINPANGKTELAVNEALVTHRLRDRQTYFGQNALYQLSNTKSQNISINDSITIIH